MRAAMGEKVVDLENGVLPGEGDDFDDYNDAECPHCGGPVSSRLRGVRNAGEQSTGSWSFRPHHPSRPHRRSRRRRRFRQHHQFHRSHHGSGYLLLNHNL